MIGVTTRDFCRGVTRWVSEDTCIQRGGYFSSSEQRGGENLDPTGTLETLRNPVSHFTSSYFDTDRKFSDRRRRKRDPFGQRYILQVDGSRTVRHPFGFDRCTSLVYLFLCQCLPLLIQGCVHNGYLGRVGRGVGSLVGPVPRSVGM